MAKIVGIIMCPMNWTQFLIPHAVRLESQETASSKRSICLDLNQSSLDPKMLNNELKNWGEWSFIHGDFLKYIWGALVLIHNLNMLFGTFHEINQSFWEIPPFLETVLPLIHGDPCWSLNTSAATLNTSKLSAVKTSDGDHNATARQRAHRSVDTLRRRHVMHLLWKWHCVPSQIKDGHGKSFLIYGFKIVGTSSIINRICSTAMFD